MVEMSRSTGTHHDGQWHYRKAEVLAREALIGKVEGSYVELNVQARTLLAELAQVHATLALAYVNGEGKRG